MENIVIEKKKVFTVIPEKFDDKSIYGEKIIKKKNLRLRTWNPYRSKLSAALILGLRIHIKEKSEILYLGAATGTTVSHLSDILYEGRIYAVEISPFSMKKLLELCEKRNNIFPILEDANHPERYQHIVPEVDLVYQDISQRNQVDIFVKNCDKFLKGDGEGIIMVKSRSIDVSAHPREIYRRVEKDLEEKGYKVKEVKELDPYAKDHACIVIRRN